VVGGVGVGVVVEVDVVVSLDVVWAIVGSQSKGSMGGRLMLKLERVCEYCT
jgi:hypothetical protein